MGQGPSHGGSGSPFGHHGSWHATDHTSDDEGEGYDESMRNSTSNRKRLLGFDSNLKSDWDAANHTRSLIASPTCLVIGSCIVAVILLAIMVAYIRRRRRRRARIEASLSEEAGVLDLEDQKVLAVAEDQYGELLSPY
ncbi:hypothetical protein EV421DRAFT_2024867 [Armillaria borealis]|uniref:Uncharacterized protein n=1 Tax=Armillaria borealis TaxID=47425 RepID=A0AA39IWI2_9AGAR|nr:hypothetical protein EV421DRAFT_2024867 [Armillaria borealis]